MENRKMEMKAEAIQLIEMLGKPHSERMPFEGVQIAKSLQKVPFFARFFDCRAESFISMCLKVQLLCFPNGKNVYESEISEPRVYVVLGGTVVLLSQTDDIHLEIFHTFGEAQILFGHSGRFQKAIAMDGLHCLTFKASAICQMFIHSESIRKCLNFINANPYFGPLSPFDRQALVLRLDLVRFRADEQLCSQGTAWNRVIFVVHGRIAVRIHTKTSKGEDCLFEIDSLEQMASYGEYECLNNSSAQVDLFTLVGGLFYKLDYEQICNHKHPILNLIGKNANAYPDHEELEFLHRVKSDLKKEQNKAMKLLRLSK